MSATDETWKKFLHPETLRMNLIAVSLFITVFEMFKDRVTEKPETFFSEGFDEHGHLVLGESYRTEVLSKNRSRFYASLLWVKEQGGIDQDDLEAFDVIRKYRNELAHEPLAFVASSERNFDATKFKLLTSLFCKIEKWWVIYFELPVNPEMLPEGAGPEEIIPGPVWSLQLLLDIALCNEQEEGFYYNVFMQNKA